MPVKKTEPDVNALREIENDLRDMKNWAFVFAKQYELSDEARDMLHEKIDEVAQKVGKLTCK